jgi:hypothetical protein
LCHIENVTGIYYPRSRLRASRLCGGWSSSLATTSSQQVMWWMTIIYSHGFMPAGLRVTIGGTPRFMPYRLCDRWLSLWPRLYAMQYYMSLLIAHEALCHTGNVTGVHYPRSRLFACKFYVSPLMALEASYYSKCMMDPHLSWITAVCLSVWSEFVIKIRVTKGKVSRTRKSSVEIGKKRHLWRTKSCMIKWGNMPLWCRCST